ncbi:MAG: hypothetical protein MJE68_16285 [Proteobacteria bacterium]|nr:hypothetical protein [Pseudomonadota bacterium]
MENELRRIEKIDFEFRSDADIELCMDMIEECRQTSIYPHLDTDCTTDCKERGL